MISDTLFELAFAYKKTKLWNKLFDSEIFAVRLPDGEIGYCSVMGAIGEHCAVALYVGAEGLRSLMAILSGPNIAKMDYYEFMLSQNCLQCAFENKDELTEEEAAQTRDYAREHGIQLRGRGAFPHFVKYQPNRLPWFIGEEKEQQNLCEALAAAIAVAERLEQQRKDLTGLKTLMEEPASIPLLERKDGGAFAWSSTELPRFPPVEYPRPRFINDIAAARVRMLKKEGLWECRVLRFPEPMQDDPGQAPYFPMLLIVASNSTGEVLTPQISPLYEEEPEDLVEKFAELFVEHRSRPAMLSVSDERTRVLLEDFCARAGIRIRICETLPVLDEAVESLMSHLGMGDTPGGGLDELLDLLLQAGSEELTDMPDELRGQLVRMLEEGILPEDLAEPLAEKLGIDTGRTGTKRSYVISVSCSKGCYRHIRIAGSATLLDLHDAIQESVDFENDHAFAFFMDNTLWSDKDAYYVRGLDDFDGRFADDYSLDRLGLTAGRKFKYLFDFGDEWVFQCKVLKILEEDTEIPTLVRIQGASPRQYE